MNRDQPIADEKLPIINAIQITDPDDDGWIRIVPVGRFPNHPGGSHEITPEHITQMADNFNANSSELLFDYDHGSVFRSDSRAAGWSAEVEAREDGLYARFPEFTNTAKKAIDDREYRFFSPVYFLNSKDKKGNQIGATIHSVALTNTPYMAEEIDHIGNSNFSPGSGKTSTKTEDNRTDMKLSKENLARLGLNEDATEEEVNQAIANSAIAPDEKTETKAKEGTSETPAPVESITQGGSQASDEENDRISKLEAKLAEREQREMAEKAEVLVNSAVEKGKILPRDKQAYLNSAKADYDKTKEILDEIKVNSVKPGSVKVNTEETEGGKVNSSQAFRDYIKPKMALAE